jgi:Tfp pilus assembly protein PilF
MRALNLQAVREHRDSQRLAQAHQEIEKILVTYPDNLEAILLAADIASTTGKKTKALQWWERAI